MLPKHRAKNRLRRRVIQRVIQIVAQPVARADHLCAQAAKVLPRNRLIQVGHQARARAADHAENRNEDNNEKLHN